MTTMTQFTCLRCGHTWMPRTTRPVKCPNPRCQSPYWDEVRKENQTL
jgi:DNA-directed RNA polymerase subunit RPC12/RpoP